MLVSWYFDGQLTKLTFEPLPAGTVGVLPAGLLTG